MSSAIPVSASSLVPISAYYPYDENIKIQNSLIQWSDGYEAFEHNAFKDGKDYSANKETIFYLPPSKGLFTFLQETSLTDAYQGAYLILSINTGMFFNYTRQYVTAIGTDLYLNSLSTDNSFFRFIINDDGTFSLFQGPGLYVTVEDKTPFTLSLQRELPVDESYKQRFYWHEYQNQIYFSTKTTNPASIGPTTEERFWSFSKVGPEKGIMRANGILPFNDYVSVDDMYKNDYLFDVSGFVLFYKPTGLITDHTWIRYYNEFIDKTHNKDVEIFESKSISGIDINHLFDLPYNTKIDVGDKSMAVNLANLKNVMTGEYEYRTKPESTIFLQTSSVWDTTLTACISPWEGIVTFSREITVTHTNLTSYGAWSSALQCYAPLTYRQTKGQLSAVATCPPMYESVVTYVRDVSVGSFTYVSAYGPWEYYNVDCYPYSVVTQTSAVCATTCSSLYEGIESFMRDVSVTYFTHISSIGSWVSFATSCYAPVLATQTSAICATTCPYLYEGYTPLTREVSTTYFTGSSVYGAWISSSPVCYGPTVYQQNSTVWTAMPDPLFIRETLFERGVSTTHFTNSSVSGTWAFYASSSNPPVITFESSASEICPTGYYGTATVARNVSTTYYFNSAVYGTWMLSDSSTCILDCMSAIYSASSPRPEYYMFTHFLGPQTGYVSAFYFSDTGYAKKHLIIKFGDVLKYDAWKTDSIVLNLSKDDASTMYAYVTVQQNANSTLRSAWQLHMRCPK